MSKAVLVILNLIMSVALCSCIPTDSDEQSTLVIEPTSGSTSAPPTPISQSDYDQILKSATDSSPAQTSVPNYRATLQAFTLENQTKLSEDEITALFNLEMNEPDCVLPCWNGITPGVSKIADLETFFGSLGFDQLRFYSDEEIEGAWVYSDDLTPEEWRHGWTAIDAQLNRGKDEVSLLRITYLARRSTSIGFQPANLLHEFGYPEIVLMDERRQGTEFQLLLAYPDKGISLTLFVSTDNSGTMLCIKKPFIKEMHVLLVDPSQDVIYNSPPMKFPQDTYYFSSISTQEVLKLISQSRCVPLTW